MEEVKRCTTCRNVKPLTEFSANKNNHQCKMCRREYQRNWAKKKRLQDPSYKEGKRSEENDLIYKAPCHLPWPQIAKYIQEIRT